LNPLHVSKHQLCQPLMDEEPEDRQVVLMGPCAMIRHA
jgi:hypothetical protein